MDKQKVNIAIDGPSGAGKSTIARLLAKELGFIYVDTGAMYRAIGLYAQRLGYTPADAAAVADVLSDIRVDIGYQDGAQHIYLNGEDVSAEIRTEAVSKYASAVSAMPEVRAFLLELQRTLAASNSVIMDGRDIGTVILPQAEVKIFLTADDRARARRRYNELREKGQDVVFEDVLENLRQRDKKDSERALAPLRPADDAVLVDTTDLDLAQSVEAIKAVIRRKVADV